MNRDRDENRNPDEGSNPEEISNPEEVANRDDRRDRDEDRSWCEDREWDEAWGRDEAQGLPREIPPTRDLWPHIRARLQPHRGESHRSEPHTNVPHRSEPHERKASRPRWMGLALAAGVAALVATSVALSGGGEGWIPGPETDVAVVDELADDLAAVRVRELAQGYESDLLELRILAESRELSPETREVLDTNLGIIEDALDEARAAVQADPHAPRAVERLQRMYDAKIDLFQLAVRQVPAG